MKLTPEQIAALPALIKTKTNQQIADEFGVKHWIIGYHLQQLRSAGADIPIRQGRWRLNPDTAEIVRLRKGSRRRKSMLLQEIADEFGLSRERVRQIVKAAEERNKNN